MTSFKWWVRAVVNELVPAIWSYAPVRYAVANGYTAVALGAGSYQGKVLRGAEVRGLWSVIVPPDRPDAPWAAILGRPSPQAVDAGCA